MIRLRRHRRLSPGRRDPVILSLLLLMFVAGVHLWRWPFFYLRWWCADELEHLHAAYCVSRGLLPYRDFFEHHTPLLYFLLAPLFRLWPADQGIEPAQTLMWNARGMMWLAAAVVLILTWRLGWRVHSAAAGGIAAAWLACSPMFIDRTTEIRPDLISVPALLGAVLLVMPLRGRPVAGRLVAAGALLGVGLMATPKVLFALPGFAATLMISSSGATALARGKGMLRRGMWVGLGGLFPVALVSGYFIMQGGGRAFVLFNFFNNAQWQFRLDPFELIGSLIFEHPALAALGSAGTALSLWRTIHHPTHRRAAPAWVCLSLVGGLAVMPVPYTQYYLMFLPLLAVEGAAVLVRAMAVATRWCRFETPQDWLFGPTRWVIALATLAMAVQACFRPATARNLMEWTVYAAAGAAVIACLTAGKRYAALAAVVTAICFYPLRQMPGLLRPTNESQFAAMAWVMANTRPDEPVFDGWDQMAAPFRPHADFYFFLHREIRPMLAPAEYERMAERLESGQVRPALVVVDRDTRALPPRLTDFFTQHYEPTGVGAIWRPRERQDD